MNEGLAIALTGFTAAALNSLGGGGSFVTLPVLLAFGLSGPAANAVGTVGLLPGGMLAAWAYRSDLSPFPGLGLPALLSVSLIGGAAGAVLLIATPTPVFDALLPWLVMIATLAFAMAPWLRRLRRRASVNAGTLLAVQAVLSVYTGYFGGGVGIMMVAVWSLVTSKTPHEANALRMLLVPAANAAAAGLFLMSGLAPLYHTSILLLAGLMGGWLGASAMKRLRPAALRYAIIAIGASLACVMFVRAYT
ncbi:sulfite exporter TauE/SafE family protein [Bosea vestrisii]|uniref:Probable membrane transporter protein n=1 Tax=Bosea vestrisii TaxID=151416 RepID=A0ABW0HL23_9HYPH